MYIIAGLALLTVPLCSPAQVSITMPAVSAVQGLPSAPTQKADGDQGADQLPSGGQTTAISHANPGAPSLTLKQAEDIAIKNNPQISVARLIALASQQVTREARSALWPTATGDFTGVGGESGSRIAAGGLNSPHIYQRIAAGVTVTQLITDFGRTSNLISSANYAAQAEHENAMATQQQILLAVNQAFYNALQTQAVLVVAQKTVDARQTVADQINALFQNKLRSELDSSFANVNLAQAKLLLLDAQNNDNAAQATLSMVLGFPALQTYQLVDSDGQPAPPPDSVDGLISEAFSMRPEIRSLQFQFQSARKFQTAERDLLYPTIRAMGVTGDSFVGDSQVVPHPGSLNNTYGAVGADVDIPIFNGFLYTARAHEANLKAQATQERLVDMRNLISRDVRTSWLNTATAYQRLAVTQQLVQQANLALDLAQSRYKLGLSSIVELSQAQLQQTQAAISYVQAGYEYRLSLAVLAYQTAGI
ncbi:MAG: TolC family protein [Terracidiphilus sp.]